MEGRELPEGVADGVEQSINWRAGDVRFGVVTSGTPFWEWLAGRGFIHVWTSGTTEVELESKLGKDSVDVVMFEHVFPRHGHAVWSAAGVKLVVWSRGPSNVRLPVGWTLQSLTVQHSELGGVTDGVFHVRVARRVEVEFQPPREFVGVSATLLQIMDPTVGGRTCPEGEPTDGATNTAKGLLNWNQRRGSVAAPSVFPGTPWVTRKLTDSEFLAALDVPATRAKTADVPTAQLWGRELRIPFKVRLEVCDWVCSLARAGSRKRLSTEGDQREAKRPKTMCGRVPALGGTSLYWAVTFSYVLILRYHFILINYP